MTVIVLYTSVPSTIFSQEAPAAAPRYTKIIFQIKEPSVVKITKRSNLIFAIPAGMEIKLRTIGDTTERQYVILPYGCHKYY